MSECQITQVMLMQACFFFKKKKANEGEIPSIKLNMYMVSFKSHMKSNYEK